MSATDMLDAYLSKHGFACTPPPTTTTTILKKAIPSPTKHKTTPLGSTKKQSRWHPAVNRKEAKQSPAVPVVRQAAARMQRSNDPLQQRIHLGQQRLAQLHSMAATALDGAAVLAGDATEVGCLCGKGGGLNTPSSCRAPTLAPTGTTCTHPQTTHQCICSALTSAASIRTRFSTCATATTHIPSHTPQRCLPPRASPTNNDASRLV